MKTYGVLPHWHVVDCFASNDFFFCDGSESMILFAGDMLPNCSDMRILLQASNMTVYKSGI